MYVKEDIGELRRNLKLKLLSPELLRRLSQIEEIFEGICDKIGNKMKFHLSLR